MNSIEYYNKTFGCIEKKPNNFTEDEIIWRLEIMPELKSSAIITKSNINDVFEIFEWLSKRDNKSLKVLEVENMDFMFHLINKRGFKKIAGMNVEKHFKKL